MRSWPVLEMIATAKPDSLVGMFSFGGLNHEQVRHSIELFATKDLLRAFQELQYIVETAQR